MKEKIKDLMKHFLDVCFCFRPTQNYIMFESAVEFEGNAGEVYRYLLKKKYNEKYKMIWLVNGKKRYQLPKNVKVVPKKGFNLRRYYYMRVSRYQLWDNEAIEKRRKDQCNVFLMHSGMGLKNTKNIYSAPSNIDYLITTSEGVKPILCYQLSVDPLKAVVTGLPRNDVLFEKHPEELKKIKAIGFDKIILWMPTFRKHSSQIRNDSSRNYALGLPIIYDEKQLNNLNDVLKENNVGLIIKLHPAQDISSLNISDNLSNIIFLTSQRAEELELHVYELMTETDALLSDYSSVSFDYMLLDKPIGFTIDDIESYKIGFSVENPLYYMAGNKIYTYEELVDFIVSVKKNEDNYKEERHKINDFCNFYKDANSCERVVELLNL